MRCGRMGLNHPPIEPDRRPDSHIKRSAWRLVTLSYHLFKGADNILGISAIVVIPAGFIEGLQVSVSFVWWQLDELCALGFCLFFQACLNLVPFDPPLLLHLKL